MSLQLRASPLGNETIVVIPVSDSGSEQAASYQTLIVKVKVKANGSSVFVKETKAAVVRFWVRFWAWFWVWRRFSVASSGSPLSKGVLPVTGPGCSCWARLQHLRDPNQE